MNAFKRIFLMLAVNILVVVTLSITLSLLGVRPYLSRYGIDYEQLAMFCLVWGMGASFISLLLSRVTAKMFMGVQVIDPKTTDYQEQSLLETVYTLAKAAGLTTMPEVGIYDSPDLNAFATGPSRSRSLVAVSSGLLTRMNQEELEGVLGHEITHISNGDMVTLTLIQGVINAFVMFLARALAFAISQAMRGENERERGPNFIQYILVFVFEIMFSLLGSIVVAYFSRYREFKADAGSARIAGKEKMIRALQALKQNMNLPDDVGDQTPKAIRTFRISSTPHKGFMELIATHPPLEDRIAALEALH